MRRNWKRNLLVGVVVGLIFFGWFLRGFLWINWHFKLFSGRAWNFLLDEFRAGWMLSALSDWIFLFSLCFAVPLFLYLWYLCSKVHWRRLFKKILAWLKKIIMWPINWLSGRNAESTSDGSTDGATAGALALGTGAAVMEMSRSSRRANQRPRAMTIQHLGPSFDSTPKTTFQMPGVNPGTQSYSGGQNYPGASYTTPNTLYRPSAPQDYTLPKGNPGFDMENESYTPEMGDISNMPLEDIHLPERQAVFEDFDAIWTERGYRFLSNVSLPTGVLDYVAVCQGAIWACLFDREPSDWLADEESFNGEDPLWFSEIDHRISPIFILKKLSAELGDAIKGVVPAFMIKPLLIEQKGNIINAEDMMKTWLEMGISVCRTDVGGSDDLPLFGTFIPKSDVPVSDEVFDGIQGALVKGE